MTDTNTTSKTKASCCGTCNCGSCSCGCQKNACRCEERNCQSGCGKPIVKC